MEVAARVKAMVSGEVVLFVDAKAKRELPSVAFETQPLADAGFPVGTIWTRLSVVADISPDADLLYYGFSYRGDASLWVDDVRVGSVSTASPVTEPSASARTFFPVSIASVLATPSNLSFERTRDATTIEACERVRIR